MLKNNQNLISLNPYSDEQVIAAILQKETVDALPLRWFFQDVKGYAIGLWRKKYRDVSDESWEDIFTDATIKLITRVKKGLRLQEGTKLKSYFTGVVEYAVLDHFAKQKKDRTLPIEAFPKSEATHQEFQFEKTQVARLIQEKLQEITDNPEQVSVILLVAKGYRYREIVEKTSYKSEGACRNAYMKGKRRIVDYILKYPEEGRKLRSLLLNH